VLTLRTRDFVIASRGFGARSWHVIFRHPDAERAGDRGPSPRTLQVADAILI